MDSRPSKQPKTERPVVEYPRDPGIFGRIAVTLFAVLCGLVPTAVFVGSMRLVRTATQESFPNWIGYTALFPFFLGAFIGYLAFAQVIARRPTWTVPIILAFLASVAITDAILWASYGADTALTSLFLLFCCIVLAWFVTGGPMGLLPHESIDGSSYRNSKLGFTISHPGLGYRYVIRGGRFGAAVAIYSDVHVIYVTVHAAELPTMTFESYAESAQPRLSGAQLVRKETLMLEGGRGERREWLGERVGGKEKSIVLQTIVEGATMKYVVTSDWPARKDSEDLRQQQGFIHSGFRLQSPQQEKSPSDPIR